LLEFKRQHLQFFGSILKLPPHLGQGSGFGQLPLLGGKQSVFVYDHPAFLGAQRFHNSIKGMALIWLMEMVTFTLAGWLLVRHDH
jgi:hypothetical protein